jgi:hypothetical protein
LGGAGAASRRGEALGAPRVCLPEGWGTDADAARRPRGHGPAALTLPRPPQGAAARGTALGREGRLPCKASGAACLSGPRPPCLDAVEAGVGRTALGAMPSETRGGRRRPRLAAQRSRVQGAARAPRGVGEAAHAPRLGAPGAARLPASSGLRRQGADGPQGPLTSAWARPRVTRGKDGLPDRTVWRVRKRTGRPAPS